MESIIISHDEVDCVGSYCPMPLFMTKEKIEQMKDGEVLKVEADDPSALKDITGWAKRSGHRIIKFNKEDNLLVFYIKKGG